jgi:hypothetical protein
MAVGVSGTNEKFLTKEFVIPKIYEIMEPYLAFVDMFPKVQSTARTVAYKQEKTSDSGDANKQYPRTLTSSGQFTYVTINQMEAKAATLNKKGFAIKIDQDAIDFTEGVDEIQRALRKVGFWLAQDYDNLISAEIIATAKALTTSTSGDGWSPTAVWSADTSTPIKDLEELEDGFIKEGYPYRLTDLFINKTNFKELKEYLTSVDIGEYKQTNLYGVPTQGIDRMEIPVVGTTVHRLLSGISEGAALALDKNNPGMTIFYNNSPRYSTTTGSYKTMADGSKVLRPYSLGFNFDRFTDRETHEEVLQFWYDVAPVTLEPYALFYKSSGI